MQREKIPKIINFFVIMLLLIASTLITVNAVSYTEYTATVTATAGLNVRSSATTNSSIVTTLPYGEQFKYTDSDVIKTDNESCNEWIYVSSKNGYICKTWTQVVSSQVIDNPDNEMSNMTDEEFDAYLTSQGFDGTYKTKLKELHKRYPNWVFKGIKTERDWNATLKEESQEGRSTYYIDSLRESAGQEAYLSTTSHYNWHTNLYTGYDGMFFLANEPTVAYFLDPRNFLNESSIFMFESLKYEASFQTKDKIAPILGTGVYSDIIFASGQKYNYSPLAIAAKIRQEGTLNNRPTLGNITVTCNSKNGYTTDSSQIVATRYAPLYNFFNIGAYTSPKNADLNGLCYAGTTNENYLLPWNTTDRAIEGGTKWIASNYVNGSQYTNYFQKFNTANPNTALWHQYMTNIEDPKSQGALIQKIYSNNNLLRTDFVFYIPIYNNMPSETKLPKLGNPNNWLTSLTVKVGDVTNSVSNFDGSKTDYQLNVASNINNITINSTTVAKTSYVSIDGSNAVIKTTSKQVSLKDGENTFNIVVTAGNGDVKTYTLKVNKETQEAGEQPSVEEMIQNAKLRIDDKYVAGITFGMGADTLTKNLLATNNLAVIQISSNNGTTKTTGALGTGDKVTITSNGETKTYEIVIYGDISGDGQITLVDIVFLQKHLWNSSNLSGARLKAADANKDGVVKLNDIVMIQKHLWKDIIISQ